MGTSEDLDITKALPAIYHLEKLYEDSLWHAKTLIAAESSRLPRLQLLLAEHDKDTVQQHLYQTKTLLDAAETRNLALENQSIHLHKDIEDLKNLLSAKHKEFDTFQASLSIDELASLRLMSAEMAKLQAENRNLAREISNMTPEINRLRSQNSSYQSILSEKLSLERQLSSLEIELQNQKRIAEHARRNTADESKELNSDGFPMTSHHDAQHEIVGSPEPRLPKAKNNDASKKQERDSGRSVKSPARSSTHRNKSNSRGGLDGSFTHQIPIADADIATPGQNLRLESKKRISAAPGEKSFFSITPFLNRQHHDYNPNLTSEDDEEHVPAQPVVPRQLSSNIATGKNTKKLRHSEPDENFAEVPISKPPRQKRAKVNEDMSEAQSPQTLAQSRRTVQVKRKQNPLPVKTQASQIFNDDGIFAESGTRNFEIDRRNRRLGANRGLDPPQFSPLKRKTRVI
ncbi:hypothetical protein FQN57_003708 [Myotisia sp. PD_48]|nr:hypothetical protein FQN57_003708 [Myotisia sp. PD_48]